MPVVNWIMANALKRCGTTALFDGVEMTTLSENVVTLNGGRVDEPSRSPAALARPRRRVLMYATQSLHRQSTPLFVYSTPRTTSCPASEVQHSASTLRRAH
jgi:hypothetical protein